MKSPTRRILVSIISVCLLFTIVNVSAQDLDDVTISGRVTDSNGQAIAGASVTATHTESGTERTVTTNDEGRYRLIELKPGIYIVNAASAGFGTKQTTDLNTISGQNVQLHYTLVPADIQVAADVIVSEDDAPLVDTTRTVVGGTIEEREIEEIPNTNRNPLDLVLTLGGTTEESLSTSGLAEDRGASPNGTPLEQGNFSLSGGTAYSNNITIDGLDNNDDRSSRDRFQPSLEAVAEVQVITNQFSAEYGRASGGRINLRTSSGGNRFRGRAFMFYRSDNLNANSWYNNANAIERPEMAEYNPGFTFRGPVVLPFYNGRSRTFFSVAYEYLKLEDTTLIDAWVPVGTNPNYTLPASTGGEQGCDSSDEENCTKPVPTAGLIAPYKLGLSTPNRGHIVTARVDHKLFRNNDLTVGWQFGRKENRRTNGNAVSRIEDTFQAKNSDTDAYNFTDNHVFGANAVNQLRGQWSVYEPSFQTANPLDPVVLIGYRDPNTNSVRTLVAGNSTTSTSLNFADSRKETRWQLQDALTYIAGSHTFKGGFDIQRVNSEVLGLGDATGTFNFNSVLNYQNNVMSRYRQNFGTGSEVTNTYYGFYFNDEFKPLANLTVSTGLRYERETAVSDNNNWGPRVGVAWDPFKRGKGVIRFGAGIFYNRVLLRTVADSIQNAGGNLVEFDTNTIGTSGNDRRRTHILAAIAQNFPSSYASVEDLKNLITTVCPTVPNPEGPCNANTGFITNVSSSGNPLRSVEADLKIPESYQMNVGFEREIGKGFVFEANYTWNKTAHLWRDSNPNAPSLALANEQLGTNYKDWTEYLLANTFSIKNQNGTTRTYRFVLGSTTDLSGVVGTTGTNGNVCSFTLNNTCTVNLNSTNSGSTLPAAAVSGQNNNATGSPIGIALAAIAKFRPDQSVEETSLIGSRGNAMYHGLILELRRRYRKLGWGFGTSMRVNYTLSGTKDDGLNNTANAEIDGDFSREWTRNLQDRRHRINISGTLDTPHWMGKLRFSPLFRWGSSAPFNIGSGGSDRNLDDLSTDRVNFSGDIGDIVYREPGTPFPADLASRFSLQPIGSRSGNLRRNAGTGPSFYTFDLSVTREFRLSEKMRLRPVIQFDNILNAAVFSYGAEFIDFADLYVADNLADPTDAQKRQQAEAREQFLVPSRTYRQRQIRIGVRFDF